MELIRTSLKVYSANRHKQGAARSWSFDSRFKPSKVACNSESVISIVQLVQQISFDDLCQIYPHHKLSGPGIQPQQSCDEVSDVRQSQVDLAAKIDGLRTADVVNILLQPAVLDTVVAELENCFLSE